MTSRKAIPVIVILVFIFLFSACTNAVVDDALEEEVNESVIPTPSADTGVVYGKMISEETGKAPQANIFLSKNITADDPDVPAMLSFSYQTNPRAQIDEEGNFKFIDVPPGMYAITLWTPPNDAYFIPAEDGQDYLWVYVEAGASLDMGEIVTP